MNLSYNGAIQYCSFKNEIYETTSFLTENWKNLSSTKAKLKNSFAYILKRGQHSLKVFVSELKNSTLISLYFVKCFSALKYFELF